MVHMNDYSELLAKAPREVTEEFFDSLAEMKDIMPYSRLRLENTLDRTIRYYRSNNGVRSQMRELQTLEKRWYESLETGLPLYSVYDDPVMLLDVFACFVVYSRNYLRSLCNTNFPKIFEDVSPLTHVLDLGCGVGYTTKALSEIFKKANVYGTNFDDSRQMKFCERQWSNEPRCKFMDLDSVYSEIDRVDLVFASEYFEHLEEPITELKEIIRNLKPKWIVVANAFNTKSVGHFHQYHIKRENSDTTEIVHAKEMSKEFIAFVIFQGYDRVQTTIWNNRPTIYRRVGK